MSLIIFMKDAADNDDDNSDDDEDVPECYGGMRAERWGLRAEG